MSLIIKRSVKGSPLTSSEVDANVNNLNNDKVEIANSTFTGTPSLIDNLIPLTGTVLPAIYPTLNLDFANSQTLDPRVTFARSSTATYTDKTGLVKLAPANIPRFDFDPINRKCLGLLIEEGRTNLLVNSTIDGANLATQNITTTEATRTLSFYGSGTVTLSGTATATIVGLGAYPTRTTYTYTPTAGTLTVTVSGTVQYANDELGSFATSFMPTAGTSFSRVADNASMTGVNFSSWYNQAEGSFFAVYRGGRESSAGGYGRVISSGSATHFIASNGSNDNVASWNGSTTTGVGGIGNMWDIGGKAAISYSLSATIFSVNGTSVTNTTLPTWSTKTPAQISIGGPSYYLNGHIRKITYYPKALTATELQGLTR